MNLRLLVILAIAVVTAACGGSDSDDFKDSGHGGSAGGASGGAGDALDASAERGGGGAGGGAGDALDAPAERGGAAGRDVSDGHDASEEHDADPPTDADRADVPNDAATDRAEGDSGRGQCPTASALSQDAAGFDASDAADHADSDADGSVRVVPPNTLECVVYHNGSTVYSIDSFEARSWPRYFFIGGSSPDSLIKVLTFDFTSMKWSLYGEFKGADFDPPITTPVRIEAVSAYRHARAHPAEIVFIVRSQQAGGTGVEGLFQTGWSDTGGKFIPWRMVGSDGPRYVSAQPRRRGGYLDLGIARTLVAAFEANAQGTAARAWHTYFNVPNVNWVLDPVDRQGNLTFPPSPPGTDLIYGTPVAMDCGTEEPVLVMNTTAGLSVDNFLGPRATVDVPPGISIENLAVAPINATDCAAFLTGTRADGSQALYRLSRGATTLTPVASSLPKATHLSFGTVNGVAPVMLTSGYGKSNGLELHFPDGPNPTAFARAGATLFPRDACTAEQGATLLDLPGFPWSFFTIIQDKTGAMSDVALCLAGEGDPAQTQFKVHMTEP